MTAKNPDKKPGLLQKYKNKIMAFGICLGVVAVCSTMLLRHYRRYGGTDLITSMENFLLDTRFRFRGVQKPTNKVGILAIDEKTLQKFGRWPISRKYYEQAFKNLKGLGVQWMGFDVVWASPELPLLEEIDGNISTLDHLSGADWKENLNAELAKIKAVKKASLADQSVARGIHDFGNIVEGFYYYASEAEAKELGDKPFDGLEAMQDSFVQAVILPDGKEIKDYPELIAKGIVGNAPFLSSQTKHFSFFNNESDTDAIMRWVTLVRSFKGNLMPALSLKVAAEMLQRDIAVFFDPFGITAVSLVSRVDDKDVLEIPTDHTGYGRILINHLGPDRTIPHFSLVDAAEGTLTEAEKAQLKGMSLLLGPTAIAINDQRANPFDAGINGVENHAAVIDNIASGHFMRRSETIYQTELLLVLAIGLLFSPLMVFGRAAFSGIGAVLFMVAYYYFDKFFWFSKGQWVYMGMPFIEITALFVSTTLYKYMTEERERKKLKGTFSVYLSPEVIDEMVGDPSAMMRGEKKILTVFFSDVRGFTTISESLTPEKLRELMIEYFTPMTDIIMKTRGCLDKFIGDAIMAFWGAPVAVENHADVACKAALQMLVALDKLRVDLPKKGFPAIDIGIGLNTGPMSVGNMGSPQRASYTVMGDNVNLGSRLEGLTKDYGIKCMISEFTQKAIVSKDLFTRDLDDIRVKGKHEPVKVFDLIRPDLLRSEADIRNLIGEFEKGREGYRKQDWNASRKAFMACLAIRPDDGPASLYLERIEERAAQPSIPDWDGVYTFKHK